MADEDDEIKKTDQDPFAAFKNEGEGCAVAINLYAVTLLMLFENMTEADFDSLERMESVWYLLQQIEWRRQEFDQLISERVLPLREKAGIFPHPSLRERPNA